MGFTAIQHPKKACLRLARVSPWNAVWRCRCYFKRASCRQINSRPVGCGTEQHTRWKQCCSNINQIVLESTREEKRFMRGGKSVNYLFNYQIPFIFITEGCNPKVVPRYKPAQPCPPLCYSHRVRAQNGW